MALVDAQQLVERLARDPLRPIRVRAGQEATAALHLADPDVRAHLNPAAKVAGVRHAVPAEVNHGRWIAVCPPGDGGCGGAQLTSPADPRFLCVECANAAIGGRWRPVSWPTVDEQNRIAYALEQRPVEHRHWSVDEPVDVLTLENAVLNGPPAPHLVDPAALEGHTHTFPTSGLDDQQPAIGCTECGQPIPAELYYADRAADAAVPVDDTTGGA